MTLAWARYEIDLAFVREFSTLGEHLTGPITGLERRERIRTAIYRGAKQDRPFFDSGMTYGEAFRLAYSVAIERRAMPRPAKPMALVQGQDAQQLDEAEQEDGHPNGAAPHRVGDRGDEGDEDEEP